MQKRFPILYETALSQSIEAKETVAVNEEVYIALQNYLSKEDVTKSAQPHLIVGEAGSGKTFLLKRLVNSIKENMGDSLYPVIIEGKSLFSTEDIWFQCASHLNIEHGIDMFDAILGWQEMNLLRIVLLIDNIQYYFDRTDNAAHFGLRGKLNRDGAPVLIATSEKVLPAFTEYNAAFFDGFKISYLKALTLSAIEKILNGKYDLSRLERMMSYMPKTIRSMLIAVEIMDKSKSAETDLDMLADCFSLYYQAKYDASLKQIQRILSALASSDMGIRLPEIRRITKQENGKISPYLKLMTDQNIIIKESKTQRGGTYTITDPLFRLWLRHNTI